MNIKIEKFEGPMSLLLKLIEKEELDITKIYLADITDQYVDFVKKTNQIDPSHIADFLVVAARLLYIKSRALLPFLYIDEEDGDDADDLERQLKIYKEFLDASVVIEKILGEKKIMFSKEFNKKAVVNNVLSFSPPQKIKKEDLKNAFIGLLTKIKPLEKIEEKTMERKISLEEKIINIQKTILKKIHVSFQRLISKSTSKSETIVSFLAVLELMRQGEVVLHQEKMFGDIMINKV